MKKTFLKEILHRRIPQIIGSYLIASISLVGALDWMVARYELSGTYVTLAIFCLISIIPSVFILAYFHGAPGKDEWTKIEKYGIPVNVLFIGLAVFFGKSFETKEPDKVLDNFYWSINSSQKYIDQWKEVLKEKDKTFSDYGIDGIEPLSDNLLEDILKKVPIKLYNELRHREIITYFPKNKKESQIFSFLSQPDYYVTTNKESQRFLDTDILKEKFISLDDSLRSYYDVNIDGYVKIYLYRKKIDQRWGITYELLYSRIYDKKNKEKGVEVQFGSNDYIAWEDDPDDDIVNKLVEVLAQKFSSKRYGGDRVGRINEILDEKIVSINFKNKSLKIIKGTKLYSRRTYDYHVEKIDFTYENFDKEIDDIQREMKYVKNNPKYILETNCNACLEWDLDTTGREHDVKNINFILEEYLAVTQARIDELQNNREKLIDNMEGTSTSEGNNFRNIYLEAIKITNENIIAKIISKDTPYIIPKIGDHVLLDLD